MENEEDHFEPPPENNTDIIDEILKKLEDITNDIASQKDSNTIIDELYKIMDSIRSINIDSAKMNNNLSIQITKVYTIYDQKYMIPSNLI